MRTLILDGSTRKNVDTAALLGHVRARLCGDLMEVSCADAIAPCCDCRHCWRHPGCAIRDDMQAVYRYLADCDNLLLASPIWFSSLSGPLLNIASRLQPYFCAKHFRQEALPLRPKRAAVILVGAQKGTERAAKDSARRILGLVNVARDDIRWIDSMNTDRLPAAQDEAALAACECAARWLNRA